MIFSIIAHFQDQYAMRRNACIVVLILAVCVLVLTSADSHRSQRKHVRGHWNRVSSNRRRFGRISRIARCPVRNFQRHVFRRTKGPNFPSKPQKNQRILTFQLFTEPRPERLRTFDGFLTILKKDIGFNQKQILKTIDDAFKYFKEFYGVDVTMDLTAQDFLNSKGRLVWNDTLELLTDSLTFASDAEKGREKLMSERSSWFSRTYNPGRAVSTTGIVIRFLKNFTATTGVVYEKGFLLEGYWLLWIPGCDNILIEIRQKRSAVARDPLNPDIVLTAIQFQVCTEYDGLGCGDEDYMFSKNGKGEIRGSDVMVWNEDLDKY